MRKITRRTVVQGTVVAAAGIAGDVAAAKTNPIPTRALGKTGVRVSAVGLGGAHVGRPDEALALRIMHRAIDEGLTFFDNSWDYNEGRSEEVMGKALAAPAHRRRVFLMTKVCAHRGDRWSKAQCLAMLDESLRRLRTDHLDLWQLHEVGADDHPDKAFAKDAAMEALLAAKKAGKTRFLGFTGHRDPGVHLRMLAHDFPYDAVQMPLNVMDAHHLSFERQVLPVLQQKKIAPIGMKALGGGNGAAAIMASKTVTAVEALHYAMNLPVATVVTGIESLERLDQALMAARTFKPLTGAQVAALLARTKEAAGGGTFERYKKKLAYRDGAEPGATIG